MEVDRGTRGMPDLGCGVAGSPAEIATQVLALAFSQGGVYAAFHEGCEAFNLGHHQRGSERGPGRFIPMAKNPHPPLRGNFFHGEKARWQPSFSESGRRPHNVGLPPAWGIGEAG